MEIRTGFLRILVGALCIFVASWAPAHGADPAEYQRALEAVALPLHNPDDLEPMLAEASAARVMLLGESTHGTSEYYRWRAEISKRLIEQGGVRFIAVEGDWASLLALNDWIKADEEPEREAADIMRQFQRWPEWMWANREMLDLVEWLREWNANRPAGEQVGLYGMDVYGFWEAMDLVKAYYRENKPEMVARIEELYELLEQHRPDQHAYAREAWFDSARQEVADAKGKLRERLESTGAKDTFLAWQSAAVVAGAEGHLRAMGDPGPESWNTRARHMHETVLRLLEWFGPESRGIVWAHNTHIGDARATAMAGQRQVNIGQLMREEFDDGETYAVGFACATGRVLAGGEWGAQRQTMQIPEPPPGTLEAILSELTSEPVLLLFSEAETILREVIGHRAIGVVYNPAMDPRQFVPTRLADRYNALLFFPETEPLDPLHP